MTRGGVTLSPERGLSPPFPAPPPLPLHWAVFDCETSGLEKPDILVAAVWSSRTNWTSIYLAHELEPLAGALEAADVVVTYNGKGFDRGVLEHLLHRTMTLKHHIDIYQEITACRPAFEKGWKLEDVARRLWGVSKQRPSAEIPAIWAVGRHLEVVNHCLTDVYLTRSLMERLRDVGWVPDPTGMPCVLPRPTWWNRLTTPASGVPSVPVISV